MARFIVEKRFKFAPALIKRKNNEIIIKLVNKNVKVRTYTVAEKTETSIVTQARTDYSGSAPKRYTTKCYIKPASVPTWYTESLFLNIGSTRRKYEEKVYFKNKLLPYRWTESMYTEIKTAPKNIVSDIHIPVEKSDVHYISFEPQQIAAGAN